MRTMDGDFHPEGKIPDGCQSSFSSLLFPSLLSPPVCVAVPPVLVTSVALPLRSAEWNTAYGHSTQGLCTVFLTFDLSEDVESDNL